MSELVGMVLKEILTSQGFGLLGDGQTLADILSDICPDEKRSIQLVMRAFSAEIPQRLLQFWPQQNYTHYLNELSQAFQEQQKIHPRFADWVVQTWAAALGRIPVNPELRNPMAEAEEELRHFLRPLVRHWKHLPPDKIQAIEAFQQQLWLSDTDLARIRAEVQAELERVTESAILLQSPKHPPFHNSLGMRFIRIEPGQFLMGSPEYEHQREVDEQQHWVTLSRPYWIQAMPVTQSQWQAIMGDNPADFKGAQNPVENVSWLDIVQRFLPALNARGEGRYRLPSEAEWEYAARAGSVCTFYNRHDASCLDAFAWYQNNSGLRTHPVGQKQPNAWGLYDMYGNVWEWCQDWYAPYGPESVQDPRGPAQGCARVMRGGSWFCQSKTLRQAARGYMPPDTRIRLTGFRLVMEADEDS